MSNIKQLISNVQLVENIQAEVHARFITAIKKTGYYPLPELECVVTPYFLCNGGIGKERTLIGVIYKAPNFWMDSTIDWEIATVEQSGYNVAYGKAANKLKIPAKDLTQELYCAGIRSYVELLKAIDTISLAVISDYKR